MSREELVNLARYYAGMVGGWEGLPKIQFLNALLRDLERAQDRLEFLERLVDVAWQVYEDWWRTKPFLDFASHLLRKEYDARRLP